MAAAERSPLLVTGAGGMLGHVLCRQAQKKWPVIGVYHRHQPEASGFDLVQADLCQAKTLEGMIQQLRPAAVIHTAAMAHVTRCRKAPLLSEAINVQVPARLAQLCALEKIPFVFTSTDLVFDGTRAPYDENASVAPLGVYARHKARAEALVLQAWPQALICRLPLMIGLKPRGDDHFCRQMLRAIRDNRPLTLFIDEYRTPVDTRNAADGILLLLGRARGLMHLGGHTRLSRHALGLMMAAAMGVEPTMIQAASLDDHQPARARARDVSLDSRKAFAAGYAPLPIEKGVHEIVKTFKAASQDNSLKKEVR